MTMARHETTITATVKNDQDPRLSGMDGQTLLTFITTLGTLTAPTAREQRQRTLRAGVSGLHGWRTAAPTDGLTARAAATVTLIGAGREGTATVTITHGTLDPTSVDVTLFGDAKNLAAEAEQGSVEQGGSVFVVLTVTDGAGNPSRVRSPERGGEGRDRRSRREGRTRSRPAYGVDNNARHLAVQRQQGRHPGLVTRIEARATSRCGPLPD